MCRQCSMQKNKLLLFLSNTARSENVMLHKYNKQKFLTARCIFKRTNKVSMLRKQSYIFDQLSDVAKST